MPAWFAHLLPGGPWRRHLQRWAKLDPDEADDFSLLVAIGHDLPGAVTVTAGERARTQTRYQAPMLAPSDAIRFSLAGAQWKLFIRRGEHGLTIPVQGQRGQLGECLEGGAVRDDTREACPLIAKFGDPVLHHLARVEWATTDLAGQRRFDAIVPSSFDRVAQLIGREVLVLRRQVKRLTAQFVEVWNQCRDDLPLSPEQRRRLDAHLGRLPLIGEAAS